MSDNREDLEYGYQVHDRDEGNVAYVWWVKGPSGAVHIWGQKTPKPMFGEDFYGGIELHHKVKPYEHMPDEAPIKDCWLTGCDCWPDGSSLFFSERLLPHVEDHHRGYDATSIMESYLFSLYSDYFGINGVEVEFL